jgi:hypothetical protein
MKPVVLAGTLIISKLQEAILVVQTFEMSVESQNLPQLMHDWHMPIAKQRENTLKYDILPDGISRSISEFDRLSTGMIIQDRFLSIFQGNSQISH